jgi:hypothetical protein
MKRAAIFLLVALAGAAPLLAEVDPKARQIGEELIAALGGMNAWEKSRQLMFDFVVERDGTVAASFSHAWDRYTGDYRVSGTDRSGAPWVVYFNVNTKQGVAFSNGVLAEGEQKETLLKNAYGRFINDTYWLLCPWKIFDPGVNVAYEGEKPCPQGGTCDVLKLSFNDVGMTPKDLYWLWITKPDRRMVQWQYLLNGATGEPTTAEWKDWQSMNGMKLSMEKTIDGRAIKFKNVAVSPTRDDRLFQPPAPGSTP